MQKVLLNIAKSKVSLVSSSDLINIVFTKDPDQPLYHQAFTEIIESLEPVFQENTKFLKIMEMIAEPERVIQFRVPWMDDEGEMQCNRGFRVQFNSAIGPYKGGLRFDGSRVNLDCMKFLGFEQTFKNALTSLPMGGAKGGSDFSPKGKSEREVMMFCQSFMTELQRHIGPNTDIPAGDIGVGQREVGYMFGQYKRIKNEFTGVITGKKSAFGGSLIRPEATGYGSVWFAEEMLKTIGESLEGKRCLVSGSGNVAQYTVEKLLELGAVPLTMSDRSGTIYEHNGITSADLEYMMHLKNVNRGRMCDYAESSKSAAYFEGMGPWQCHIEADLAFPSATQNEINESDALVMARNGVYMVCEGANMPSTPEAIKVFQDNGFLFGPAKAANCGGVACSGLEMSQNSLRLSWTKEEVAERLHQIMINCHQACYDASVKYGDEGNLQLGANIASFLKISQAMEAYGSYHV